MDRRRLSAIALLKRLKKYEMEKVASELGKLRHSMVQLEQQRQVLADGIGFKIPSYDADFTPYMQQFVPAAKAEIRLIAEKMAQLEPNIATLEKQVSDKFQKYKTFDIIHSSLSAEMRRAQEARENAEIEETILWRWTKNRRTRLQQAKMGKTLHEVQKR